MVSLSPPMNIVVHYCPDTNQERNIKEGNTKEINTNALKKTKWAGECLWNLSSAKLAKFITKIITNIPNWLILARGTGSLPKII